MRIDHVIYATADLSAAAARITAEHGLNVLPGGRHDGLGTENMIVPLGGGYLELLAVVGGASQSPLVGALTKRLHEHGDGLWTWVVEVDDVGPISAARGTAVATVSRDGFSAQVTGVQEAMGDPFLPFFISRDEGVPDAGAGGDSEGIEWVEVEGDATRLAEWLGEHDMPLRVLPGDAGVTAVGLGDGRRVT